MEVNAIVPTYPVAVLFELSLAVTVTSAAVPALIGSGIPVTSRVVAAPALTVIAACVPVIEGVPVSVAVTLWSPTVARVTPNEKVCTPLSPGTKV